MFIPLGRRSVASANETVNNSSCDEGRGTLLFKVSLPVAREAGADRSVEYVVATLESVVV